MRPHSTTRALDQQHLWLASFACPDAGPASKSLKGQHCTRHTFAVSNGTLSSNLDLQKLSSGHYTEYFAFYSPAIYKTANALFTDTLSDRKTCYRS